MADNAIIRFNLGFDPLVDVEIRENPDGNGIEFLLRWKLSNPLAKTPMARPISAEQVDVLLKLMERHRQIHATNAT